MSSSKPDPNDPPSNVDKGQLHERLAADYFECLGFTVRHRNWRTQHKEIDLVVEKPGVIVFVEVKSAGTRRFGHPVEWVDKAKIKNLVEAATAYLIEHRIEDREMRFDVVTFYEGKLEHFPNAFSAAQ